MDLGPLYFGWPLPSNDFDVTMANDGFGAGPKKMCGVGIIWLLGCPAGS